MSHQPLWIQNLQLPITLQLPTKAGARALYARFPRTVVAASVFALATPWLVGNYRKWMALGLSGLPHNALGWLLALLLKPIGRETLSTAEYDRDANKEGWLEDAASLPRRQRARPKTGWHFFPHRQLEQRPSAAIKASLEQAFRKIAADNAQLVEVQKSPHERTCDALVVHAAIASPHAVADAAWREIAHIHTGADDSLHVVLAPQDCKRVIRQGWGERHPASGRVLLPKEYLMIYAPNSEEEVEVVGRIVKAAVGYMTNSHQVN